MNEPILVLSGQDLSDTRHPIAAAGQTFEVHEWSGSGPDYLHVEQHKAIMHQFGSEIVTI